MLNPKEIQACEDLGILEDAADEAGGYCAVHNSCDPGCKCFTDDGELCIYQLINERIKEIERKENL